MTNGYTKLFGSLLTSSLWSEDDKTRLVWITILALSDRDGYVAAALPGLARASNVTLEDCAMAVAKLEAPDKWSRSQELEGRRLVKVEGGWRIVNYLTYMQMMNAEARRDYNRKKMQEHRARIKEANKGMAVREVIRERVAAEYQADH